MHLKILVTFHSNVMHQVIEVKIAFEGFIAFKGRPLSFITRVS